MLLISYSLLTMSLISFSSFAQVNHDPLTKCYELSTDASQTTIKACLLDELRLSEEQLNVIFNKSKGDLEDSDSIAAKSAIDALVSSQEQFILFRSSECQRQSALMMGGNGADEVLLACEIKLNQWRAKLLLTN
nr:flagellar biogenesis regulator UmoC [Proteus sp. G2674]